MGVPSPFQRRYKKRCRTAFFALAFLSCVYFIIFPYVILPFVAEKLAYPLFCDEANPCQNHSVSLYSHIVSSGKVASCQFSQGREYAIVLLVLSQEKEFSRRNSIRNSWGKSRQYRKTDVVTFFLLAKERYTLHQNSAIFKESAEHNDLIFADMVDSYMNLTLKVLHGLTWAERHCPGFQYLVKVDSDVFFNPFVLIDYLMDRNLLNDPFIEFLGGSVCRYCPPRRAFFDQWAVSYLAYPHAFYPDYTHGPCYVISRKTVEKLVLAFPYVRMIPYEDVFFTGIVTGMYLKTPRTALEGNMGYSGRMEYDLERYATNLISSHKHPESQVEKWWNDVVDFRKSHNILLLN